MKAVTGVLLAAIVTVSGIAGYTLLHSSAAASGVAVPPGHNSTFEIRNGTMVGVQYVLLDGQGVPFYTNAYPSAQLVHSLNPSYAIKAPNFYSSDPFVVGGGHILGSKFEASLLGHKLHDVVQTRYLSASELGHAWGGNVSLATSYGPFPLVETVSKENFHKRINETRLNVPFRLNYRYNATITSETADTVTFAILIADGQVTNIAEMGAKLTAHFNGDGTFSETLSMPNGHIFTRSNTRLFELGPGSYIVDSTDASTIHMRYSSLRNSELIGKGATILAQVTEVYTESYNHG